MGVTRKTLSIFTIGLIDFRSDKERIARYSRQTRNAARKQVQQGAVPTTPKWGRGGREIAEWMSKRNAPTSAAPAAAALAAVPAGPPPGWYEDQTDQTRLRWWDGQAWGEHTQPKT